jgi:hypothetical protein
MKTHCYAQTLKSILYFSLIVQTMTLFSRNRSLQIPTLAPNQTLFPALPLEVREQIYHHTLLSHTSPTHPHRVTIGAADTVYNTDPRYPTYLPRLCRIDTTTRIEFGLRFIRNTEFRLLWPQYLVYLSQFLSTYPDNSGFDAVRKLGFEAFGRHIPSIHGGVRKNAYIGFIKKCSGLLNVTIKYEVYYLLKNWPAMTTTPLSTDELALYKLLNTENIANIYILHGLFELKTLKTLVVEVYPRAFPVSIGGFYEYISDCWPVMEGLVEWLREIFRARGMKVDVSLLEVGNPGMGLAGGQRGEGSQ